MIGALLLVAVAALEFEPADIRGVRVNGVDSRSGLPFLNFRRADVNGDGAAGLVLADRVLFQIDGVFSDDNSAALPELPTPAQCDVWPEQFRSSKEGLPGAIYYRHELGITVLQWKNSWTRQDYDLEWPVSPIQRRTTTAIKPADRTTISFTQFLHDTNADGAPEIIAESPRGIHIYALVEGAYKETHMFQLFDELRVARLHNQSLWPPAARRLAYPDVHLDAEYFIDGNLLTILSRRRVDDYYVRYRVIQRTLDEDPESPAANAFVTGPLPNHLLPCRLNDNPTPDFAGTHAYTSLSRALQPPIFETTASLDGAKSASRRVYGHAPLTSFTDFNGDGRHDLITEHSGLFDGGTREAISRLLTDTRIAHEFRVHYQNSEGGFSQTPDVQFRFHLHVDKPPVRRGYLFEHYVSGDRVNGTGDFNGDGLNDLAIHAAPNAVRIHVNDSGTFSASPEHVLPIPPQWTLNVVDVNSDGRSDIILQPESRDDAPSRIYFSRTTRP